MVCRMLSVSKSTYSLRSAFLGSRGQLGSEGDKVEAQQIGGDKMESVIAEPLVCRVVYT